MLSAILWPEHVSLYACPSLIGGTEGVFLVPGFLGAWQLELAQVRPVATKDWAESPLWVSAFVFLLLEQGILSGRNQCGLLLRKRCCVCSQSCAVALHRCPDERAGQVARRPRQIAEQVSSAFRLLSYFYETGEEKQ